MNSVAVFIKQIQTTKQNNGPKGGEVPAVLNFFFVEPKQDGIRFLLVLTGTDELGEHSWAYWFKDLEKPPYPIKLRSDFHGDGTTKNLILAQGFAVAMNSIEYAKHKSKK
jgi:hypothetical protein